MDYWEHCLSEALEDAGMTATKEQLDTLASWVEGAHENYGLATGLEVANRNFISDEARELERLQLEINRVNDWTQSTEPCKVCLATGTSRDSWGRDITCDGCNGEGRTKINYGRIRCQRTRT